ncbi:MAG: hypothetical protein HYZ75_08705 [Elusimicrobia bacterium]|nr:hypothetical protein [Elusimicrobiota bacterium]
MRPFLRTFSLLSARKARSALNGVRSMSGWEWVRNLAFGAMGLWMMEGLRWGFFRLLSYLDALPLLGPLLIWKLVAMAMLTTFSMVIVSSLVISLTSFFYAEDLRWLVRAPVPLRALFADKAVETVFFSSWMIVLVILPMILALAQVKHLGPGFLAAFFALLLPALALSCAGGMAFTLVLMAAFPSSRTRDAVWILSSLAAASVYVFVRAAEPERLVRPDAMQLVSEYLRYLQAPTAPRAPSWWLTEGLAAWVGGAREVFWLRAAWLYGAAGAAAAVLLALAGRLYARGYSGAQEGGRARRPIDIPPTPEARLRRLLGRWAPSAAATALFWKERTCFVRDVKHWSQLVLIAALIMVYLFSIDRLPLDTAELKSLVCFLNIGVAGFVLSSLGLRFTFPAVSLEGRSYWVARAAPLSVSQLMGQKLAFCLPPTLAVGTALVAASNHLLGADRFVSVLTLGTIWLAAFTLSAMGVGFGALFPRFKVENIHQVESSAGGFVYMACALGFIGLTLAAEAWPVKMHFDARLGRANAWDWRAAGLSALMLLVVNAAAAGLPWVLGRRALEAYEGD